MSGEKEDPKTDAVAADEKPEAEEKPKTEEEPKAEAEEKSDSKKKSEKKADSKKKADKKADSKEEAKEKASDGEKESKKIVVHRIAPNPHAPSTSPFVMKLETFLRMAKLDYEIDTNRSTAFSTKGKTPWVSIDGKAVNDTQLIIEYIRKERGIDLEKELSNVDKAVARAFRELLESHFYFVFLTATVAKGNENFVKNMWGLTGFFKSRAAGFAVKKLRSACETQGSGRHSLKELLRFAKQDLRAVSHFLADKPYLMGDSPTVVDTALFGAMVQIMYQCPPNFELGEYCETKLPNLVAHTERVREAFWPGDEWNSRCREAIPTKKEQVELDKKAAEEKAAEEKAAEEKAAEEKAAKEKEEKEAADKEKADAKAAKEKEEEKPKAAEKEKDEEEKPKAAADEKAEEEPKAAEKEKAEEKPAEKEKAEEKPAEKAEAEDKPAEKEKEKATEKAEEKEAAAGEA